METTTHTTLAAPVATPLEAQPQYKDAEAATSSALYDMEIATSHMFPKDETILLAVQKELNKAHKALANANKLVGFDSNSDQFEVYYEWTRLIFCPHCSNGTEENADEARNEKLKYGIDIVERLDSCNNAVYRCVDCKKNFVSTVVLEQRTTQGDELIDEFSENHPEFHQ